LQGFYESSPKICSLCNGNCLTCSKSASNCTSCNIQNPQYRFLYNFQCIETCPFGYTNVGAQCVKCDSTCSTCVNNTSTCTSCDTSSPNKYFFGYQCLKTCPEGTQPNPQTIQCVGCLKGCTLCDSKNQTKCLQCKSPLLEFQGSCVTTCPSGYSINFFGTACTNFWTFNFPSIPYPHLMACGAMVLIALISKLKDWRKALLLPNLMILCSPVEFVS
jgi:proprotein convertase subtilisin/kexin type 5